MPSLREIRGRIRSARNIQQITKAMKMVAAARLRRAQDRMLGARPYAALIAALLRDSVGREDAAAHPLLRARPAAAAGTGTLRLVVLTADKGLCGAFNVNVLRRAVQILREQGDKRKVEVVAVGRKGRDFFQHFGVPLAGQATGAIDAAAALGLARDQIEAYSSGAVDEVLLVGTEFASVISLRPQVARLLPFDLASVGADGAAGDPPAATAPPSYEPSRASVFAELVPRAVEAQVWRALLESQACEFAARMTAMDNASRNSKELITSLTLYANRIRQAVITKEIAELVGGAEALK